MFRDTDPVHQTARRNLAEKRLTSVVKRLASTRDGLFFLRWLLTHSGVLRIEFPSDPVRTAWDAGRRALGLDLLRHGIAANEAANLLTPGDENDQPLPFLS